MRIIFRNAQTASLLLLALQRPVSSFPVTKNGFLPPRSTIVATSTRFFSTADASSSSTTTTSTATTTTTITTTTDTSQADQKERLFSEELNIIYDSKCNVCKMEIDWLRRRDERLNGPDNLKLKLTDLESDKYNPKDPVNGKIGYRRGMESIHAITPDGKVLKGVPVFSMAYQQVGLGWLFAITQWPILSTIAERGYDVFAKYRTHVTRGSSIDELVQVYEERQKVLKQQETERKENCNVCQSNDGNKK